MDIHPPTSQKVKNIERDPRVSVALEDGLHPIIFEGTAAPRLEPPWPDELAPHFKRKYDWDFRTDDEADYILVEIAPSRLITW